MQRIAFHEEADFETLEAARYYEERAAGLGLTFLDEIEKLLSASWKIPLLISVLETKFGRHPWPVFHIVSYT
jgi:hypothetical protein